MSTKPLTKKDEKTAKVNAATDEVTKEVTQEVSSTDTQMQEMQAMYQKVQAGLEELARTKKEIEERAKVLHQPSSEFSPLQNKVITLRPIAKVASRVIQDKSEATWLTGTKKSYNAQEDMNGRIINPLTLEEQKFFEKLLKIDLSVDKPYDTNFWVTKQARIIAHKTSRDLNSAEIKFNLLQPYDYIKYKIALAHNRIANNLKEAESNPLYEMVIIDEDAVLAHQLDAMEVEDTVLNYLYTNKNHKKNLLDLLRLYGMLGISLSTPVEKLYLEGRKLVDNKNACLKLRNLIELNPAMVSLKVLIQDAIALRFILVRGNEYSLQGGQVIGHGLTQVEQYFNAPNNQTIKLSLEERVKTALKQQNL